MQKNLPLRRLAGCCSIHILSQSAGRVHAPGNPAFFLRPRPIAASPDENAEAVAVFPVVVYRYIASLITDDFPGQKKAQPHALLQHGGLLSPVEPLENSISFRFRYPVSLTAYLNTGV